MDQRFISAFQKNLLAWYKKNARDLPWRHTKDPYAIWVSEIMLQQTQVKTVIPYYQKWMKRFPSVQALAKAPLNDVLSHWAGLGYYRRARMLHQAAKELTLRGLGARGKGAEKAKRYLSVPNTPNPVPSKVEELMKLPGIGRYTAGAIASIAFDQKAPILDGNVIRILTRILAIPSDIAKPETLKKLWDLSEKLVSFSMSSPFSPGDFNQAMMELGATVCFPENPECGSCPAARICRAHARGKETFYPVRKNREKIEKIKTAALILRKNGKVFIRKQKEKARWGGLWMFPHWQDQQSMLHETGLKEKNLSRRITVKHGFTKYQMMLEVYEAKDITLSDEKQAETITKLSAPRAMSAQWCPISRLHQMPMPSPHKKIAETLLKNGSC